MWVTVHKISVYDSLHQNTRVSTQKLTLPCFTYTVFSGHRDKQRLSFSQNAQTMQLVSISERTHIPVQMEKVWASDDNKMNMEILVREKLGATANTFIVSINSSGIVFGNDVVLDAILLRSVEGELIVSELNLYCEEADTRIVLHVYWATKNGATRIVIVSNDTDVVVLLLRFMAEFASVSLRELWVRFGIGEKTRFILVHTLLVKPGADMCNVWIKIHLITECDATSKIETKHTAMKVDTVTALKNFGEGICDVADHVQDVETFLVKVWKPSAKQTTFC